MGNNRFINCAIVLLAVVGIVGFVYMLFNQIFSENVEVIVAGITSVIFAFLVWSVKESYKRHGAEVEALKKVEIILAINLGGNSINKFFLMNGYKP